MKAIHFDIHAITVLQKLPLGRLSLLFLCQDLKRIRCTKFIFSLQEPTKLIFNLCKSVKRSKLIKLIVSFAGRTLSRVPGRKC